MTYITQLFLDTGSELALRQSFAKKIVIFGAVLFSSLQLVSNVNSPLLSLQLVAGIFFVMLITHILDKRFSLKYLYSILASVVFAYICMTVYLSDVDIRFQIMFVPLLPLILYFLNPLWLYNVLSVLGLSMIIVMRDSYLYTESGHLDELGLVQFSYALVWAVLLIEALSHRRANSGLQNDLYYDVDSGVLDTRALLRVLEKSVANTLRYEQKMSVVMFEFHVSRGSITSVVSTGSKFESGLLAGISANLRRGDTLAKWKDNSFVIIVPENDAHGCEKLLSKLTQIMQHIRLPGLDTAMIHYGIAVLKHQSHTELLDVAEKTLEENKSRISKTAI